MLPALHCSCYIFTSAYVYNRNENYISYELQLSFVDFVTSFPANIYDLEECISLYQIVESRTLLYYAKRKVSPLVHVLSLERKVGA